MAMIGDRFFSPFSLLYFPRIKLKYPILRHDGIDMEKLSMYNIVCDKLFLISVYYIRRCRRIWNFATFFVVFPNHVFEGFQSTSFFALSSLQKPYANRFELSYESKIRRTLAIGFYNKKRILYRLKGYLYHSSSLFHSIFNV